MAQDATGADSPRRRSGLLRDQVQLVKKKDNNRHEIVPIQDSLSFEKGFFIVIRACQLLSQKNDGITFVGVAGPSGAGKTVFTEKVLNFMPSIAVITMDNYNDSSRIIDGNFDGKSVLLFLYCQRSLRRSFNQLLNFVGLMNLKMSLILLYFLEIFDNSDVYYNSSWSFFNFEMFLNNEMTIYPFIGLPSVANVVHFMIFVLFSFII